MIEDREIRGTRTLLVNSITVASSTDHDAFLEVLSDYDFHDMKVLMFGLGYGKDVEYILQFAERIHVVEFSEAVIRFFHRNNPEDPRLTIEHADMNAYEYKNEDWDVVIDTTSEIRIME